MSDVPSPDWLNWAFWAEHHDSIRDLVIILTALVGIPFVAWREWLHHRQTKAALQQAEIALQQAEIARQQAATAQLRHEAQLAADRERRITDNFTRAVELLGSEKLETRLGAIYTLERIARESVIDHWPVMETLTAYVRDRTPAPSRQTTGSIPEGEQLHAGLKPPTDIQAVLTVIGRRRREHEDEGQLLDLTLIDVRGAFLADAHLGGVYLKDAILAGANLFRTHLEGANLEGANLRTAVLRGAHLEGASLFEAHLEGAFLQGAHLEGAILFRAHLENAHMRRANLEEANLDFTQLQGADLTQAHLEGASLDEAHLEGANLKDTDLTQEQFDNAITDENTKVPPHIKRRGQHEKPAGEIAAE